MVKRSFILTSVDYIPTLANREREARKETDGRWRRLLHTFLTARKWFRWLINDVQVNWSGCSGVPATQRKLKSCIPCRSTQCFHILFLHLGVQTGPSCVCVCVCVYVRARAPPFIMQCSILGSCADSHMIESNSYYVFIAYSCKYGTEWHCYFSVLLYNNNNNNNNNNLVYPYLRTSFVYWAQQSRYLFSWWRRQNPVSETSCIFNKQINDG
jgi:hypothetical protein